MIRKVPLNFHGHRVALNFSRRFISYADLSIERSSSRDRFDNRPAKEDLTFGTTMSNHMLKIEWEKGKWSAPNIVPYGDLLISPAASALHYGLACFEGMKAYKTIPDEEIRLFRPDLNMERLSGSMERLHMPGFDFDRMELLKSRHVKSFHGS